MNLTKIITKFIVINIKKKFKKKNSWKANINVLILKHFYSLIESN